MAASGLTLVIPTREQREGSAYRQALKIVNRDYPGLGWRCYGIAY